MCCPLRQGAYCQCVLNSPDAKMGAKPQPTLRHDSLQADDVGMIKLRHDGCFSQEVPLLLLRVAHLQGLQGHRDVSLPRQPHASVANLSEFTWTPIGRKENKHSKCKNRFPAEQKEPIRDWKKPAMQYVLITLLLSLLLLLQCAVELTALVLCYTPQLLLAQSILRVGVCVCVLMVLPEPMIFSILILEASISRATSWTAWQGSSYVCGSI